MTPEPNNSPAAQAAMNRAGLVLAVATLLPLIALLFLYAFKVPLGCPGRFVYLYSPVVGGRLAAVPFALILAAALGAGIWLMAASTTPRRWIGRGLVVLNAIALGVWVYRAPPSHYNQHVFNAHSPSQDGAFIAEALRIDSVRDYLRLFPERARTPPQAMRGTRVISNPPGTTLLAVAVADVLERWPALLDFAARPPGEEMPTDAVFAKLRRSVGVGVAFFWVLTALWLMAGIFLYALGRLFLPPMVATAYALCCVFAPLTMLFSPGKDPAQLVTLALPLWLWFLAVRHRRGWLAVCAGVAWTGACLVSLVHFWLGAIVCSAALLAFWPDRRAKVRLVASAACGVVLTSAALYFLCDLDLLATARAVAHAQAEVTRGPDAMPLAWQLIGVPLFLLFAGPALWTAALTRFAPRTLAPRARDATARLGVFLLLGCVAVMLGTVGFTNVETPRLWIPFTPLLLLGLLLQLDALRGPSRRVALALAVLVGLQVAASALQWSVMDPREAENRLADQRFYG